MSDKGDIIGKVNSSTHKVEGTTPAQKIEGLPKNVLDAAVQAASGLTTREDNMPSKPTGESIGQVSDGPAISAHMLQAVQSDKGQSMGR